MKHGDWYAYCSICGRRSYASQVAKLSTYTGKGDLLVCQHDIDAIDYGLIHRTPRPEQSPHSVRALHTNTTNSSADVDVESMSYIYLLAASQDGAILMASQDDAQLLASEPI